MNTYINALLGVKQNVRPSTAINIAKGVGMLARRSPYGMAASLAAYGGKKAYDYFTEDEITKNIKWHYNNDKKNNEFVIVEFYNYK